MSRSMSPFIYHHPPFTIHHPPLPSSQCRTSETCSHFDDAQLKCKSRNKTVQIMWFARKTNNSVSCSFSAIWATCEREKGNEYKMYAIKRIMWNGESARERAREEFQATTIVVNHMYMSFQPFYRYCYLARGNFSKCNRNNRFAKRAQPHSHTHTHSTTKSEWEWVREGESFGIGKSGDNDGVCGGGDSSSSSSSAARKIITWLHIA